MGDKNQISVNTKLTEEDYKIFSRITLKAIRSYNLIIIIICLCVVYFSISSFTEMLWNEATQNYLKTNFPKVHIPTLSLIAQFGFPIAFYMFFFYVYKALGKYSKNPNFSSDRFVLKPKSVTINQNGLREETEFHTSSIKWEGIKSIEDHKSLILFYIDKLSAYVIPKHAFPTPEDAQKFYEQALFFWNNAKEKSRTRKNPWGTSSTPITVETAENEKLVS